MSDAQSVRGRHVWSELIAADTKAAETFYVNVIGWSAALMPQSPVAGYTQFKRADGAPVAGLMKRPDDMNAPPFWSMYIAVPDFDAAAAQIARLGGSALSPIIDVPTVGRMQMMKDPQGAAFYIMQPEPRENPPDRDPQFGEASWIELMTTDAPAALRFYQELFGWRPADAIDMGDDLGVYQEFKRGDRMIGGMMNKPKALAEVPPHWNIYFLVPDITSAVSRIKHNGGTIMNGPIEVPGGDWVVNAMDPQGAAFNLHAKKAV